VERAFKLKSVQEDHKKFKDCDIIISPKELDNYATFDNNYLDEIFEIGYNAASALLAQEHIKNKFSSKKNKN
jgi:NTE family protein